LFLYKLLSYYLAIISYVFFRFVVFSIFATIAAIVALAMALFRRPLQRSRRSSSSSKRRNKEVRSRVGFQPVPNSSKAAATSSFFDDPTTTDEEEFSFIKQENGNDFRLRGVNSAAGSTGASSTVGEPLRPYRDLPSSSSEDEELLLATRP